MKKISRREKVAHSKKQLADFLKFRPEERLENFFQLKHSILRLYDVLFSNGLPTTVEPSLLERLSKEHLYMDVELIPYYTDEKQTISYASYLIAIKMPYPCGEYEVINGMCGMYKLRNTTKVLISHRIAIDYSLAEIAQNWYDSVPKILKALYG